MQLQVILKKKSGYFYFLTCNIPRSIIATDWTRGEGMRILKFEITNFKGIDNTVVQLADEVPGNIVTLIGLNESGKTTILEALSHFVSEDTETASLVGTVHQKSALQDIIPKDKKAAFTGTVSVEAVIGLDKHDVGKLADFFRDKTGLILDEANYERRMSIERTYEFEDSSHKKTQHLWTTTFPLRSKRATKSKNYTAEPNTREVWLAGIQFLRARLPRIVYFPTFLFNFPDRIYLEEDVAPEPNDYYRQVIQDVLDSQGEGLSVQRHVVDRIAKHRSELPNPALFFAHFLGLDEKNQVDAVMQKISNEMSRVIFGTWSDILTRGVSNKRVQVEWFIDGDKNNAPYLQVSIIDGQSKFALSERSLGFRWFFSFLLFTQFRKNRRDDSGTIFMFDEPASNLHSRAQIKLLESFAKIASDATYIIYSTHSHYMVNPLWLEKAYIIENKAIDYENDQVDSFAVKKTDIKAIKYRAFVATNPSKTTYFQPVLDALDVRFSPLERASQALVIEGKFDFYPFIYLRGRLSTTDAPPIFPANGADNLGNLINLFRGWGVDFRVLLDDDKAGREAKKRYREHFLIPSDHIVTLGDIDPNLEGKPFEAIYQEDAYKAAGKYFQTQGLTKRQYALYFQELVVTGSAQSLVDTEHAFGKISAWVDSTFRNQRPSAKRGGVARSKAGGTSKS
jgi:ABC-type multidrug transport system ATPase subunit